MTRNIIVAFTIALGCAVTVSAQPITCGDCKKAGAEAAPIRKQIDERNAELRRLQQEQGANAANLNNLRELRLDAAGRGDNAAVQEYEQSIEDLQGDNKANREQQFQTQQDIQSLNEELEKLGRDVDACNKRCGGADPTLPTGFVDTGTDIVPDAPPRPDGVAAPPLRTPPPCDDCKETVTELEKEHQELQRRAERANAVKRQADLRDFEEQRRKVRELQRKADDCTKQCKPRTTTSLMDPRVIGGIGGVVGLAALFTGRGGETTPILTSTPIGMPAANPSPTADPIPPTTPAPPLTPPRITANGRYRCIQVIIIRDDGRHNPFINLGPQIAGDFTVVEGSITIRHPAPFVDIVDAFYDSANGRFNGDGRGTVAGIPNVGVRAEGTVDTAAGRIQFNYTMGTGGELPGGQPIAYGITLQRQ